MTRYSFALRIRGVSYDGFEDFADSIFSPEVDCTASYSQGVANVDFTWEAANLREAVQAAISHVLTAEPSARIAAIEAEGESSLAEAFAA